MSEDRKTLTRLFTMGSRWYATYREGNLTISAPTSFSRTMTRAEVIAATRRLTPGLIVAPEVEILSRGEG
jgi:hypothetical protein